MGLIPDKYAGLLDALRGNPGGFMGKLMTTPGLNLGDVVKTGKLHPTAFSPGLGGSTDAGSGDQQTSGLGFNPFKFAEKYAPKSPLVEQAEGALLGTGGGSDPLAKNLLDALSKYKLSKGIS